MGRWIVIGLVAVAVVVGLGFLIGNGHWGDGDGWRENRTEVVTTAAGETIVIERDRHFFPFFIFIPFLIIGLFWAFGGRRCRGNGWRDDGPGPQWMSDWHRREHEQSNRTP